MIGVLKVVLNHHVGLDTVNSCSRVCPTDGYRELAGRYGKEKVKLTQDSD
jgi:hypothetical protein